MTPSPQLSSARVYEAAKPLRARVLPLLQLADLLKLRQVNRGLRDVVDIDTVDLWRAIAGAELPYPLTGPRSVHELQGRLRDAARAAKNLSDGRGQLVEVLRAPDLPALNRQATAALAVVDGGDIVVSCPPCARGHKVAGISGCDELGWSSSGQHVFAYSNARGTAKMYALEAGAVPGFRAEGLAPGAAEGRDFFGNQATQRARFSADGRWLAAVDSRDNRLHLVDPATGGSSPGREPSDQIWFEHRLTWSPDNSALLLTRAGGGGLREAELYDVSAANLKSYTLIAGLEAPAFSPDAQFLGYAAADQTIVRRLKTAGCASVDLSLGGGTRNKYFRGASRVHWAPDSQRCVLEPAAEEARWRIVDVRDGSLRTIEPVSPLRLRRQQALWAGSAGLGSELVEAVEHALLAAEGGLFGPDVGVVDSLWCPWRLAGHMAAVLLSDGSCVVWNARDEALVGCIQPAAGLPRTRRKIRDLRWNSDGRSLYIRNGVGVQVVDFSDLRPGVRPRRLSGAPLLHSLPPL